MKPLKDVMKQIRARNKGEQALTGSSCRYRTDNNNCCLVGTFIPDDKYKRSMENRSAIEIIDRYDLHEYMPFDKNTMVKLQSFHDNRLGHLKGEEFYQAIEDYLVENVYKGDL